ncbi:hypothetical protein PG988_012810 [Apiospora saccharicola]
MVGLTLNRCALALVVAATLANAVDPSPEIRKKWDDKCKASGCCLDPLKYKYDTSAQKGGCCPEKTHLTWDLTYQPTTQLGLCCPPELVTSTDRATGKNHCCPPGLTHSSHLASGQGECCEPGKSFSFDDAAQKGDCCEAGKQFKVDPVTGKVGGRHITVGGVEYEVQCTHGINERFEEVLDDPTTNGIGECMAKCSANPKCQGANLYDNGKEGGCVMMVDWEYPATGLIGPGQDLLSFVPVKKR